MNRLKSLVRSKAVWGAVLGAGAWLVKQPHIDAATVVQAGGIALSATGFRDVAQRILDALLPKPQ